MLIGDTAGRAEQVDFLGTKVKHEIPRAFSCNNNIALISINNQFGCITWLRWKGPNFLLVRSVKGKVGLLNKYNTSRCLANH